MSAVEVRETQAIAHLMEKEPSATDQNKEGQGTGAVEEQELSETELNKGAQEQGVGNVQQEEVPHQEGRQDNPSKTEEELNTPEDILVSPYQPAAQLIEPQTLPNLTLRFQESWFKDYPRLHYSSAIKGVLCFYCVNAFKHNIPTMARNSFNSLGFRNWKKGREAFENHTNMRHLARQGLALRGHDNDEGNFKQHLEEKAESDPNLASWLLRNHAYTE
ncbi:unnamed protein product [Arctogadus glacialis]